MRGWTPECAGSAFKRRSMDSLRYLAFLSLLALLSSIAAPVPLLQLVAADSSYCLSHIAHPPAGSQSSTNFTSCCGPSLAVTEYLLVAGSDEATAVTGVSWNGAVAAGISPSYAACSWRERCCSGSIPPTLRTWDIPPGETGTQRYGVTAKVQYELQVHSVDSCVPSNGCCFASECKGMFGNAARSMEWSCEVGLCVQRASACSFDALTPTRLFLLFIIPGGLLLMEIALYSCIYGGRNLMADCTFGAFGRASLLVKFGPLLLRPSMFRAMVALNLALAVLGHLWNAIAAPDACAAIGSRQWAEYLYAIGYVVIAGAVWALRVARVKQDGAKDISVDILVATNLAHIVPLVVASSMGPGHSWLDVLLLAQQSLALRWFPFALPLAPFMCLCPPLSRHRNAYSSVYGIVHAHFWRAGVSHFLIDRVARNWGGGYNRRKAGWTTAHETDSEEAKGARELIRARRERVADGSVGEDSDIAIHLAREQEFVTYISHRRCGGRLWVGRADPRYAAPTFQLEPVVRGVDVVPAPAPVKEAKYTVETMDDLEAASAVPRPTPPLSASSDSVPSFLNPPLTDPVFYSALDTPMRASEAARGRTRVKLDALSASGGKSTKLHQQPPSTPPRTPSPGAKYASPLMSPQARKFKQELYDLPIAASDDEPAPPQPQRPSPRTRARSAAPASETEPNTDNEAESSSKFAPTQGAVERPFEPEPEEQQASPPRPTSAVKPKRKVQRPVAPEEEAPVQADPPAEAAAPADPEPASSALERGRPPPVRTVPSLPPTPAVVQRLPPVPTPAPAPASDPFAELEPSLAPRGPYAGAARRPYVPPPPLREEELFPASPPALSPQPAAPVQEAEAPTNDVPPTPLRPALVFEAGIAPKTPTAAAQPPQ